MSEFNNHVYEALVKDLINDAFYLDKRSRRGTISTIRQYTEIIIRRILNISNESTVTLGKSDILKKIKEKTNNNSLVLNALNNIRIQGNDCTHTQMIDEIPESYVKIVIDSLFDLYAYLLIDFFEKYDFGSNSDIVSSFSILPPIIRYIVLNYLNNKYPENIIIIDKLSLAILKAYDKEKAIKWIEEKKELLENLPCISEKAKQDIINKHSREYAESIISNSPPNMYNLCISRIEDVGNNIKRKGKLYEDFEGAVKLYREVGIVKGETPDVMEFNSIMEFLYLGRKEKKNELLKQKDSYFIINNI